MAEEVSKWEYRVQTVGSLWSGVKADELEQLLNEWGEEGWEVVSTHILENANKINVINYVPDFVAVVSDAAAFRKDGTGQ
ncbi:MAG: DUF4177 domain-containing protein [Anaerolineales bacterium]|uniref:DUF4177 domain-containing protein n=1 Tax=Candidatus Villigracilis proximus TaxID=3140683 RepID=UPI003135E94E|nr:DUF4177 domain-containing protein [Anaerolineales bacterium]